MAVKQPAMSPSEMPVDEVLDRATGQRRAEAEELLELHAKITGEKPVVWAGRIIGFGEVEYKYETGHSGRMPLLAFAPGASKHTIYLVNDFAEKWPELMASLGKHRASKVCLYLTRLTGVDRNALRALLEHSLEETRAQWQQN
ncbi:DUF1801 domain-containing protein [Leucobacter denitrificans]|uniref:DUF1801 domain-containing protein n=1 Tax=Leucobacter denitrificans TaxID=683042 RepID=A0A7G9S2T1_9MICO|nr:DUF1801 domain-containing protein [Leucobacter denitrificans]QNN62156.1 DUF1801 domain-containing protein [Leucobacter denitrificans]